MTAPPDPAFEAFVRSASPRLRATAYLLTGDAGRAEDLLQNALVAVYLRWERLEGDPVDYARRCVANGSVSWWRRVGRREAPGPVVELGRIPDLADDAVRRRAVAQALAGLTERERRVVVLRYVEDLSEQQTAEVLGIATGTVKSACARALRKLRVSPYLDELGGAPARAVLEELA
ncbi:SigE family RNA polymerase sigma factor [Motilibacter rhizosphaerae]|uniref:SigE family RNA polymerase sigma factor n=1 Tax=Motilibacter rhizosphaerae TaxID=598652 RepID=UPI00102D28B2|nr:SigE family RNA polymerase sigma factor [Motilibacter rhizosphaerae]